MRADDIFVRIRKFTEEETFVNNLADLLLRLCAVDTSPFPDVARMRRSEQKVFDIIRRELAGLDGEVELLPIRPEIESHPAYSLLHFTKTPERPAGLDFSTTYAERGNLVARLFQHDSTDRDRGRSPAVNAHIDVVKPYFPPRREGEIIFGRGACDDKGNVAAMIKAVQILHSLCRDSGLRINRPVTLMFPIEEETGGNGSLSLSVDRELRQKYDSLLVLECAANQLHPANRGAVWYKTILRTSRAPLLVAAAYIILEMEKEGAAIKSESDHPLFPQRPVQTCHGIIGGFGEHPSRICGRVVFTVENTLDRATLTGIIEQGVARYVEVYGDKTRVVDRNTGRPKVERHYRLEEGANAFILEVFGSTGHMGAILENDGAITKMAYIIREINESSRLTVKPKMLLEDTSNTGELILEGGQGFVPTHPIEEVMRRMARAADRGLKNYLAAYSSDPEAACETSYDKLHNAAFECDPDSPAMNCARQAMEICGLRRPGDPVQGWTVSCDARLFATEYPELAVITTGAGFLDDAHSDGEKLRLPDLLETIRFLVIYILLETGSIQGP